MEVFKVKTGDGQTYYVAAKNMLLAVKQAESCSRDSIVKSIVVVGELRTGIPLLPNDEPPRPEHSPELRRLIKAAEDVRTFAECLHGQRYDDKSVTVSNFNAALAAFREKFPLD